MKNILTCLLLFLSTTAAFSQSKTYAVDVLAQCYDSKGRTIAQDACIGYDGFTFYYDGGGESRWFLDQTYLSSNPLLSIIPGINLSRSTPAHTLKVDAKLSTRQVQLVIAICPTKEDYCVYRGSWGYPNYTTAYPEIEIDLKGILYEMKGY